MGKKPGLVGFGYIGKLVARKPSKEELFRESDFIYLHARATESTKGLIGKMRLR